MGEPSSSQPLFDVRAKSLLSQLKEDAALSPEDRERILANIALVMKDALTDLQDVLDTSEELVASGNYAEKRPAIRTEDAVSFGQKLSTAIAPRDLATQGLGLHLPPCPQPSHMQASMLAQDRAPIIDPPVQAAPPGKPSPGESGSGSGSAGAETTQPQAAQGATEIQTQYLGMNVSLPAPPAGWKPGDPLPELDPSILAQLLS